MPDVTTIVQFAGPLDVASLGVETALLAVQMQRAMLIEDTMIKQMETVQKKNEAITWMRKIIPAVQRVLEFFSSDDPATKRLRDFDDWGTAYKTKYEAAIKEANTVIYDSGIKVHLSTNGLDGHTNYPNEATADPGDWIMLEDGINGTTTKGHLEDLITEMETSVTSLTSSQQMEMLKLQNMSSKRNEAFELMTNWITKTASTHSQIVGNMRN